MILALMTVKKTLQIIKYVIDRKSDKKFCKKIKMLYNEKTCYKSRSIFR